MLKNKEVYIVDSHCHLDLLEEKGIKIEEILANCEASSVLLLQTICTKFSEFAKIRKFCELSNRIYCSIGVHPCNVESEGLVSFDELLNLCQKDEKIIGIGETGLDYFHSANSAAMQKESFLTHINASRETNLPVIIHSRNADLDMAEILTTEQKNRAFPALLHCFSSSYQLAKVAVDLGIMISISGIVTFKNATELQEIVKKLPLESLLVETDSPYLAPAPHRGKVCQPAYTALVVDFIAQLKGIDEKLVAQKTTENFHRIFQRTTKLA